MIILSNGKSYSCIKVPDEKTRIAQSQDGNYTMALYGRRPSEKYKYLYTYTGVPHFLYKGSEYDLTFLQPHLKDYEYFNPPTNEIKEQPCIIIKKESTGEIRRLNYNDYNMALNEFNEFVKLQGMHEVQILKNKNWFVKIKDWFINILKTWKIKLLQKMY